MSATNIEDVRKSVRRYVGVFVALMILTLATVTASSVHLAVPFAITIALIIAILKGSLVASVFMHLSNERKIIYASLVLTAVFFVFLMFLPLLGQADQVGEHLHHAAPPAAQEHAPSH